MATDLQVITAAKKDLTWLQAHTHLIMGTLIVGAVLVLGNWYINSSYAKADMRTTVAVQIATEAKQSAQAATQNAAQTQATYQALVDALSRQNAALASAIAQRDAVLGRQQAAVQTAPLTEVGQQWQAIIGTGNISPSTNGLVADDMAARKTVSMLLELPVAKANLADQTKIAQNTQQELGGANKDISALNAQVSSLNAQSKADNVACKAEVALARVHDRKIRRDWFVAGFITGIATRILVKW